MQPAVDHPVLTQHRGWPIVGILPELLTNAPLQTLSNIMERYGGFVEVQVGTKRVYLASDLTVFHHILRDNYRNYPKPDLLYGVLKRVAKNGLVTSEGDFWLRQRRMIQPHFHRKQLANLVGTMTESIATILDGWQRHAATGEKLEPG